ncbi:MAG: hypothetical protein ACLQLG_10035 [Thermoguttaceae bacterium]
MSFHEVWRRVRRALSRDPWAVRLLRLPCQPAPSGQPGLVLIQIDGLSRSQLERALHGRRMRFLRRLLRRKKYRLLTFYSGLPSATPAVQGELFYGVPCAVPSFCFRDRETGRPVRMFDPAPAAKVQARLSLLGEGLLRGGSAYCDNFSGGAAEPHFCPSQWGWRTLWRAFHPLHFVVFFLLYFDGVVRVTFMMLVELALALRDCVRGLLGGRYLWKELGQVLSRVTVGILVRELMTMGARLDMVRGLPIIHLNFLGYDEQAHRRGPASAFAHWSLRGIDHAIRRTWRAARRAQRRDYQVWIYSDHGQEAAAAYHELAGRTLQEAVEAAFHGSGDSREGDSPVFVATTRSVVPESGQSPSPGTVPLAPATLLRGLEPATDTDEGQPIDGLQVAAMGSLGQVYCPAFASPAERDSVARRLVAEAKIPLVLAADGAGQALAWTSQGCFHLPDEAAAVLGAGHPFLQEAAADLTALCHHPEAGQLVLGGWACQARAVSFSHESGAHAGPSPDETRAFAILPHHAPLGRDDRGWLRPLDLRRAVLEALGR